MEKEAERTAEWRVLYDSCAIILSEVIVFNAFICAVCSTDGGLKAASTVAHSKNAAGLFI